MEMTLEPVPTVTPTLKEKFIANGDTDAEATAKVNFIETKREWMDNNLARRIGNDAEDAQRAANALQDEHNTFLARLGAQNPVPEVETGVAPVDVPPGEPVF